MLEDHAFQNRTPTGLFRDRMYGPRGELVWERPWEPNLIVDGLHELLAQLIKPDGQHAHLKWWAVGSGDPGWDQGGEAVPSNDARRRYRKLVCEVGRIDISNRVLVLATAGNQLEILAEFTLAQVNASGRSCALREFGLFAGGDGTKDTGILVNHRVHQRIDLQPDFTLQRTYRLAL